MLKAIMLGAGMRGTFAYGNYAIEHPGEIKFVGVAEHNEERRRNFQRIHGIDDANCFSDFHDIIKREKFADCAFVCLMDRDHYEPAVALMKLGYDVICEKPMSSSIEEIREMENVSKETGRVLSVCHVLRYSAFFEKLKELIDSNVIGKVWNIQHREGVGYYHHAHSFVRGNWRNLKESSPMILQKSCHDVDILSFLLGRRCVRVSSFGSLSYFKKENAPEGAPLRCTDGCPHSEECPYYAPRLYNGDACGFATAVTLDKTPEGLMKALREGPYGRCVFHCDNDVVDHQVVNLEYEDGVSASFTMCAFSRKIEREMTIMGTLGEIKCNMEASIITVDDFASGNHETIQLNNKHEGHGGSDERMMKDVVKLLQSKDHARSRSDISISVESHVVALLAEQSRLDNGKVMEVSL